MSGTLIRPLGDPHERGAFSCGKTSLDTFLRTQAGQHTRKNMSRTYVVVREDETRVLGYYTLAASCIAFADFPADLSKKLPHYEIPSVLLARLAVDRTAQGEGLGRVLLFDALRRVLKISDEVGVHAIHVHALDDEARRFYQKYDFVPLPGQDRHLFLTTQAVEIGLGSRVAR